jgi:protein-L-isoaspartate(D-aspartate) O-methyltransferase
MAWKQTDASRQWYAEEIRWSAGISDEAIIEAFKRVPRENFLPGGPWLFSTAMMPEAFRRTPDADPNNLYHNVVVAIDPARDLNSSLPSYMAAVLEYARVAAGSRVCQIGAGLGYYSAIIAEIVNNTGSVLALELDDRLAAQAGTNLSPYANARCVHADGSSHHLPKESFDVVVVNAGVTKIQRSWVESLNDGGRLVVPIIISDEEPGQITRVTRYGSRFCVEFMMDAMVYPCAGSDDREYANALREAVDTFGWYSNAELRFDVENADDSAWLITPTYWISMIEYDWTVGMSNASTQSLPSLNSTSA